MEIGGYEASKMVLVILAGTRGSSVAPPQSPGGSRSKGPGVLLGCERRETGLPPVIDSSTPPHPPPSAVPGPSQDSVC